MDKAATIDTREDQQWFRELREAIGAYLPGVDGGDAGTAEEDDPPPALEHLELPAASGACAEGAAPAAAMALGEIGEVSSPRAAGVGVSRGRKVGPDGGCGVWKRGRYLVLQPGEEALPGRERGVRGSGGGGAFLNILVAVQHRESRN